LSANSQQLFKLNGRIALVTGSTRCIGLAASRALAYQGAIVVINGRNADTVAAVVELGKGENLDFRAMPFDVGDTAANMAALHQIGCYVGLGPRQITALGIVRSFQIPQLPFGACLGVASRMIGFCRINCERTRFSRWTLHHPYAGRICPASA